MQVVNEITTCIPHNTGRQVCLYVFRRSDTRYSLICYTFIRSVKKLSLLRKSTLFNGVAARMRLSALWVQLTITPSMCRDGLTTPTWIMRSRFTCCGYHRRCLGWQGNKLRRFECADCLGADHGRRPRLPMCLEE